MILNNTYLLHKTKVKSVKTGKQILVKTEVVGRTNFLQCMFPRCSLDH